MVFAINCRTLQNFVSNTTSARRKLVRSCIRNCILIRWWLYLGIMQRMVASKHFTLRKILKEELILSFTTASSEAVLPNIIEKKCEEFGCSKGSCLFFVIPTGLYILTWTGSANLSSVSGMLLQQNVRCAHALTEQITLLLFFMLTSKVWREFQVQSLLLYFSNG